MTPASKVPNDYCCWSAPPLPTKINCQFDFPILGIHCFGWCCRIFDLSCRQGSTSTYLVFACSDIGAAMRKTVCFAVNSITCPLRSAPPRNNQLTRTFSAASKSCIQHQPPVLRRIEFNIPPLMIASDGKSLPFLIVLYQVKNKNGRY